MNCFERTFLPGCLITGLSILIGFTAGAVNVNGSGASLHLATTDVSSAAAQTNDAGARALFAGTPVAGIVSTSGAGAKLIIEPMSALVATVSSSLPVADFAADPLVGAAPLEVQFEDLSSEGLYPILSWTWDFGDGSPYSSDQEPTHVYDNPGSYTVTLILLTAGGTVSTSKENYITVVQQVPVLDVIGVLLLALTLMLTGAMLMAARRHYRCRGKCH